MQSLKKAIKRVIAIGTGIAMLGSTFTGALAQTLDDFPAPFVVDGTYDDSTTLVVGRNAAASDTIGVANIAKMLQFESKVCVPGTSAAGGVTVSGDSVEISTTSDLLEINETLGDVRETVTEVELDGLKGGIVTTNEGTTEFNQYLRLKELNVTDNTLSRSPKVLFTKNDAPVQEVGDWLFVQEGSNPTQAFFEYELEFEDGLESDIVSSKLDDLQDEEIIALGTTYTFVDTKVDTAANSISLELLGGAEYAILEEGETRTFTIDGKEYEVEVMIIEDITPPTVTLKVNGEVTDQLVDGETEILRDGTLIGISDIVLNEAGEAGTGDIVELYVGATKLELKDTDYSNSETAANLGFVQQVKIDEETIEDGWVQIKANELSNSELEVFSIKYRLVADALPGSKDIYVPPGHGVREFLDEPQGMLGLNWDIRYEGLDDVGVSIVKLDPAGDDEYNLEFENNVGLVYKFPFISAENTNFKFGDDNDDFVFVEGHVSTTGATEIYNHSFNIGILDYFILSDSSSNYDDTAVSHIVRYNSIDTSDTQLQFDDEATGSKKFIYENPSIQGVIGRAELVFGGNTYRVYVANASTGGTLGSPSAGGDNPLAIDMNKDGVVSTSNNSIIADKAPQWGDSALNFGKAKTVINATVNGGGILVFAQLTGNGTSTDFRTATADGGFMSSTGPNADLQDFGVWNNNPVGNRTLEDFGYTNVTMRLLTLSEDFDENTPSRLQIGSSFSASNEQSDWTIVTRTGSRIGIDSSTFTSNGGLTLQQPDEDDDNYYGMTDYGVYFNLFDPEGTDNAETLTVEYPLRQRGVRTFITMGDISTTRSTAGEVCTVADIDLNTMFDDEVTDPTMYNLLLVGGPCINSAVGLIDEFATCDEFRQQYQAGQAVVQLAANGDKVALLIAGYNAEDTLAASKRVEKKQALSGSLVVV